MKLRSLLLRWTGFGLTLVLIGIQFIPSSRTNPPVQADVAASSDVQTILRRACYDCHSNETRWPWYSYVAPASWFVIDHVNHARGDLNFSEWPIFDFDLQDQAFSDIETQIAERKMPLQSYTLMHREAKLSEDDRKTLLRWAESRGGAR